MAETIIRPTMKFIKIGYGAALLAIVVVAFVVLRWDWPRLIAWLSVLLLLWPLKRHIRNRVTRITLADDHLRFDSGFLSKTTRTILISRIQDLTVHQRVGQRLFGVGDLSIETAGESSRLTIPEIDRPQEIADLINSNITRKP